MVFRDSKKCKPRIDEGDLEAWQDFAFQTKKFAFATNLFTDEFHRSNPKFERDDPDLTRIFSPSALQTFFALLLTSSREKTLNAACHTFTHKRL